jgi:hypothetical protein
LYGSRQRTSARISVLIYSISLCLCVIVRVQPG